MLHAFEHELLHELLHESEHNLLNYSHRWVLAGVSIYGVLTSWMMSLILYEWDVLTHFPLGICQSSKTISTVNIGHQHIVKNMALFIRDVIIDSDSESIPIQFSLFCEF